MTFRKIVRDKSFAAFHVDNKCLYNNIINNMSEKNVFDEYCLYAMKGNLLIVEHIEPFSLSVGIPGVGV